MTGRWLIEGWADCYACITAYSAVIYSATFPHPFDEVMPLIENLRGKNALSKIGRNAIQTSSAYKGCASRYACAALVRGSRSRVIVSQAI